VDAVWIGAHIETQGGKYKWRDNTNLTYSNWAEGSPSRQKYPCVEIVGEDGPQGKWKDVACKKGNAVVCQKAVTLTVNLLHNLVLELQRDLERTRNEYKQKLDTLTLTQKDLDGIKQQLLEARQNMEKYKNGLNQTNQQLLEVRQNIDQCKSNLIETNQTLVEAKQNIEKNKNGLIETKQQLLEAKQNIEKNKNGLIETKQMLLDAKQSIEKNKNDLSKTNQTLVQTTKTITQNQNELIEIKQNPVPIGFIYVQLPYEKSPSEVWPTLQWTDMSANYSGVFFRVDGGGAALFGYIQNENAPH